MVDYIITLRESILEAYTGIVTGMKSTASGLSNLDPRRSFRVVDSLLLSLIAAGQLLLPYVPPIFNFLQLTLTDQDRTESIIRSAVGLLGDLAEAFPGGQLKPHLQNDWVSEAVKVARSRSTDTEGKAIAKWAKEVCFSLLPYILY